jgi:hypothetical protein
MFFLNAIHNGGADEQVNKLILKKLITKTEQGVVLTFGHLDDRMVGNDHRNKPVEVPQHRR